MVLEEVAFSREEVELRRSDEMPRIGTFEGRKLEDETTALLRGLAFCLPNSSKLL